MCLSLADHKKRDYRTIADLESSQKHTHARTHESEIYLPMPVLEPVTIATRLESFMLCLRAIAEKKTSTATVHSETDAMATTFRRGGM